MTISTAGTLGFRLGGANLRLGLAQINTIVGDLDGNRAKLEEWIERAKGQSVDLLLFPELAVTGYPPEDLLLRPGFVRAAEKSLEQVARKARGIVVLVGTPIYDRDLYNVCAVCAGGEVKAIYRKRFLPNYGVFDEDRYFAPGRDLVLLEHGKALARAPGFEEALLVVDVDPEAVIGRRLRDVRRRALERERTETPPVSVVHVGIAREPTNGKHVAGEVAPMLDELELMRLALELGLRDYVEKNGFTDVVIGVSGGIDSALTAALAVEALGAERVHCVSMPSR